MLEIKENVANVTLPYKVSVQALIHINMLCIFLVIMEILPYMSSGD